MFQRPQQSTPPPTSSSSSTTTNELSDYFRFNSNNDPISSRSQLPLSALTKRLPKEGSVHRPAFPAATSPLNISSAVHSPSYNSRSRSSASPSPMSSAPRSPYLSPSRLNSPVLSPSVLPQRPVPSRMSSYAVTNRSMSSNNSGIQDVLAPGDIIGQGSLLEGEVVQLVSSGASRAAHSASPSPDPEEPAREFEVVRRLGAGSYAVVYLVKEVLYRPPPSFSDDGHEIMDEDDFRRPSTVYGREYAIKCLSKADLDEEALEAQMAEATIHQSLRAHSNIVTLHRTLETPSFLLLLLEFVPGEDLFYFLEQARDHFEADPPSNSSSPNASDLSRTPPTPGLLSTLNPAQLLGRTRLRLISAMFGQMCDAVASCHEQNVFHRDIKPENFIVTDGWTEPTEEGGKQERKVVVKLTDFGLSSTDTESSDMDCGSAPYMSYECRNNVAPTYQPGPADVWSLGIVLINMLYHYNPWTDTAEGVCHSFSLYRTDPVRFFMGRFAGMTLPVAEFLAYRVLNTLDSEGSYPRASAREFGNWIKDLPDLLSPQAATPLIGHKRAISTSSTTGFPLITSMPASHRPSSRQASGISVAIRTPAIASRSLSRASSFGALGFTDALDFTEVSELSTVIDQESLEEEQEQEQEQDDDDDFDLASVQTESRSTSTNKRRKRGARKGRSTTPFQSPPPLPPIANESAPPAPKDQALLSLAFASESLARELSTASKVSRRSTTSLSTKQSSESARARRRNQPFEPVSIFPMPTSLISGNKDPASVSLRSATSSNSVPSLRSSLSARSAAAPSPVNAPQLPKKNKWFSLGKSSGAANAPSVGRVSPVEEVNTSSSSSHGSAASSTSHHNRSQPQLSATASNVTDLIMGLSPPPPPIPPIPRHVTRGREDVASAPADDNWSRGRRMRESPGPNGSRERLPAKSPGGKQFSRSPHPAQSRERAVSPNSIQSKAPSSNLSTNWRSSMVSSAGTSTSGFTKYSNGSVRSVSTANTSVSGNSWRTTGSKPSAPSVNSSSSHNRHGNNPNMPPRNVKIMDGIPWALDELPRQQHPNPIGDIFGAPPISRKQRSRKPGAASVASGKEPMHNLGTISERPSYTTRKSPLSNDGSSGSPSASTTDLGMDDNDRGPKKVQKAQINTLAKMLSALRR